MDAAHIAYIAGLMIAGLGVWVSFVRLPNWFFRSVHRHSLWAERDQIADEMLRGQLPKDHPAVRELLAVAEHAAKATHKLTILDLYFWGAVRRRCDLSKTKVLDVPLAGLSEAHRRRVLQHRERITRLAVGSMLVGSWVGVAAITTYLIPAVLKVRRQRSTKEKGPMRPPGGTSSPIRATLVTARDQASQSSIGRAAREFINVEDGILIKGGSAAAVNGREPVGVA